MEAPLNKMPVELEQRFVESLYGLQEAHKAYWIQTRHIARALFGAVLNDQEDERDRMRVYRLSQRLLEKKAITTSERIEKRGNLNVKIVYFHTDIKPGNFSSWSIPAFEWMKKTTRRNENGN